MHRSTSSSNSGDNGSGRDLRFRSLLCFCKKLAAIRIVINHTKPSKGKLYFTCEKNECNFFKWCEPIHQGEASSSSTSTSVVASDLGFVLAETNEKIEAFSWCWRKLKQMWRPNLRNICMLLYMLYVYRCVNICVMCRRLILTHFSNFLTIMSTFFWTIHPWDLKY